jgi:pyruvate,orthophosphate dikinase
MSTRKEPQTKASGKFVYLFAAGRTDGTADMKEPARRQGRKSCRDGKPRTAGSAGLHHHYEVCTAYYANGRKLPDGLKAEVEAALPRSARRSALRSAT